MITGLLRWHCGLSAAELSSTWQSRQARAGNLSESGTLLIHSVPLSLYHRVAARRWRADTNAVLVSLVRLASRGICEELFTVAGFLIKLKQDRFSFGGY